MLAFIKGKIRLKVPRRAFPQVKSSCIHKEFSSKVTQKPTLITKWGVLLGAAGIGAAYYYYSKPVHASGASQLNIPEFPWYHRFPWRSLDHNAIRRGFKVYMQIGNNCHPQEFVYFRHLIDVAFTEKEMKALAAEFEIDDVPNEEGEVLPRKRTTRDPLPRPYANEQLARSINNGSLPPDLSLMVYAKPGGENYVFSLLTGYCPPPAGIVVPDNMYYNPYFQGCFIAMPPPLVEGMVEFDDGTEATISQMAKDVTTYIAWTSDPHTDERKKLGLKAILLTCLILIPFGYWNKLKWSLIKNRRVTFSATGRDAFH